MDFPMLKTRPHAYRVQPCSLHVLLHIHAACMDVSLRVSSPSYSGSHLESSYHCSNKVTALTEGFPTFIKFTIF